MNFLIIILFEITLAVNYFNWQPFLSNNLNILKADSNNINSLNLIESFKYLKAIDLSNNNIKRNQLEN